MFPRFCRLPRAPRAAAAVLALVAVGAWQWPDDRAIRAPRADAVDARPEPGRVPARGSDAVMDVASWNLEWFGSPGQGPPDDRLQVANAAEVIRGTDADIWGLVEIVDEAAWRELRRQLPGYDALLANDPRVAGGATAYGRGEQKVALLFKSSVATLRGARVILAEHDRAFAGRPPLEATLRVTTGGRAEDVTVIVLHMKAFADTTSWRRRQLAGRALKAYLDVRWPTEKVIVIGDWNDDVDTSIHPRRPTPYDAFVRDAARYRFVTAPLSARRVSSTTGYAELIDHHLATNELAALEVRGSAQVYRVDRYIPQYARTTSDHYPVLSHYRPAGP